MIDYEELSESIVWAERCLENLSLVVETMKVAGKLVGNAVHLVQCTSDDDVSNVLLLARHGVNLYLRAIDRIVSEFVGCASFCYYGDGSLDLIECVESKLGFGGWYIYTHWFVGHLNTTREVAALLDIYRCGNVEFRLESVRSLQFFFLIAWRELDYMAARLYFQLLSGKYSGQNWWSGYGTAG